MNKKINSFTFIILLICTVSMSSCLTVDRTIKLNKNGSGEESIKITFLKEFYSMMSSMTSLMDSTRKKGFLDSLYNDEIFLNRSKSKYDTIAGIKILDLSSAKNADSSQSFIIRYEFDSVQKIGSSLSNINGDEDKSKTDVSWINDGKDMVFLYSYEQPVPAEIPTNDSSMEQMKAGISQMFGNGSIKFEIEFPGEIISSNATSSNGNKLTWFYPMSDVFLTSKMKLEAKVKNE